MRIVELRLLAFGHFTERTLAFEPREAGLHVVYGPNEAGKSTTLRALEGVLYGIDEARDAFEHAPKHLRVGAVLESRTGQRLEIVRRRGRKDTLTGADGRPIDEALLAHFLGPVDRTLFRSLFGLDHVRLRHGAEALVSAGGAVGESLFDASRGGAPVRSVLDRLRAEAESLWLPRGKRRLNEALSRLDESIESIAATEVRRDVMERQRAHVDELGAEREALRARRERLDLERERVASLLQACELAPQLERDRADRDAIGAVTPVDAAALERLDEFDRALRDLGVERRGREQEIERATRDLEALPAASSLETVVEERVGRLERRYQRVAARDEESARLTAELARVEGAIAGLPGVLREAFDRADDFSHDLVAAVRRSHDALVAIEGEERAQRDEVRRATDELTAARAQRAALPRDDETRVLRLAIEQAESLGAVDEGIQRDTRARATLATELAELERRLSASFGGASLPTSLPDRASIDEFVARFRERDESARRTRAELERAKEDRARAESELASLTASGAVPSEAELVASRRVRDEALDRLRATTLDRKATPLEVAACFADAERAVQSADLSADRLRLDASRAAQRAQLELQLDAGAATLARVEALHSAAEAEAHELEREWRTFTATLGLPPCTPALFREQLERLAVLTRHRAELATLTHRIQDARRERAEAVAALERACGGSADSPPDADARLLPWLREARARETKTNEAIGVARELERRIATLEAKVARWRDALSVLTDRRRAERERMTRLLRQVGFAPDSAGFDSAGFDAPTSGTDAVIDDALLDLIPPFLQGLEAHRDAGEKRAVLAAITRERTESARELEEFLSAHAPDLSTRAPDDALEAVVDRHRDARERHRQRVEWTRRRASAIAARDEAQRSEARLIDARDTLLEELGAACRAELAERDERARRALELDRSIANTERLLNPTLGGRALASVLEEARRIGREALRVRQARIREELEGAEEELRRVDRDIGGARVGLEKLEFGDDGKRAADHAEDAAVHAAEARELYAKLLRIRLAQAAIAQEVDRFREEAEAPLLARTRGYFERLTRGRYIDVRVEAGDDDVPRLTVVRSDRRALAVADDALSDGTRDQLYLALRLAVIDEHAARHEAPPLVLDDALVHFDDERASATLETLANAAATRPTLLFTHHAHLVELARDAAPAGALSVHRLDRD